MTNDPLADLVVDDSQALDRQKVADFLKPYVVLDRTTKSINFHAAFEQLRNNAQKIQVVLMASKAKALVFKEPEGLTPSEIIAMGIMPEGSVKTTLKGLYEAKEIKKDSNRYFIPNYKISSLVESMRD